MLASAAALNSSTARPIQSTVAPESDATKVTASISGASQGSPETTDGVQSINPADSAQTGVSQDREDRLVLSQEAQALAGEEGETEEAPQGQALVAENVANQNAQAAQETRKIPKPEGVPKSEDELTESEQELVERLKARDAEVKAHEQAHLAAAGGIANGGPKYEYQRGPDGKQYAIGGSVNISVSPESTPEKTIAKADKIIRSALAPAEPSGKDRQIAAKARSMRQDAQQELRQERLEEQQGEESQPTNTLNRGDNQETDPNGPPDNSQKIGLSNATDSAGAQGLGVQDFGGSQSNNSSLEQNFLNNGVTYGFGNRTAGQTSLNRISLTA